MRDALTRFILPGSRVRGEFVQLDSTWQSLLDQREYPEAVREVLGQALAATALLAATIKFDGTLTLQASGGEKLGFLVVEARSLRTLRGLARWRGSLAANIEFMDLFGGGRLAPVGLDELRARTRNRGGALHDEHASVGTHARELGGCVRRDEPHDAEGEQAEGAAFHPIILPHSADLSTCFY